MALLLDLFALSLNDYMSHPGACERHVWQSATSIAMLLNRCSTTCVGRISMAFSAALPRLGNCPIYPRRPSAHGQARGMRKKLLPARAPEEAQGAVPPEPLRRGQVPGRRVVLDVVHHAVVQAVRAAGQAVQRGEDVGGEPVEGLQGWRWGLRGRSRARGARVRSRAVWWLKKRAWGHAPALRYCCTCAAQSGRLYSATPSMTAFAFGTVLALLCCGPRAGSGHPSLPTTAVASHLGTTAGGAL